MRQMLCDACDSGVQMGSPRVGYKQCLRRSRSVNAEAVAASIVPPQTSHSSVVAAPEIEPSTPLIVNVEQEGIDDGRRNSDMSSVPVE